MFAYQPRRFRVSSFVYYVGRWIGVMLIITVETHAAHVNFLLDGPLAGAAVSELARSWLARAFDAPQQRVSLDLRGVTSIDNAGKAFLARAYRHGNMLVGGGTTTALVDEIHATSESEPQSALLRVEGTLRAPVDVVLRSQVESLLQNGVRRVLLDLSGVSAIDAAGVGELIHIYNTSAAAGGAIEIGLLGPHVRRMLTVTGVLGLLTAVESPRARSTC
jgi:anti-anti-sigma factor